MNKQIHAQAIVLRKQGLLYSEIALRLRVPRSTAYGWARAAVLTEAEQATVDQRQITAQRLKAKHLPELRRNLLAKQSTELQSQARSVVAHANLNLEAKKILCASLFWCEGGKDVTNGIQFINSDPLMVHTFLKLLRECFDVDDAKLHALLHLHEYHDPDTQLQYWSKISGIPLSQFYKYYLKPHTGKRLHESYPGCISVRYGDARLGKLLKMIYSEFGTNI